MYTLGSEGVVPRSDGLQLPVPALSRFSSGVGFGAAGRNVGRGKKRAGFPRAELNSGAGDASQEQNFESWSGRFQAALKKGAVRYRERLFDDLNVEAGIDVRAVYISLRDKSSRVWEWAESRAKIAQERLNERDEVAQEVKLRLWPRFVDWNRLERWKDLKHWDARRIGAFLLYVLLVVGSFRALFAVATAPRIGKREAERIAEMYLDATIPDPTPENVRKVRQMLWREKGPGVPVQKEVLGPDGAYHHDPTFVGETAWQNDGVTNDVSAPESLQGTVKGERLPWPERLAELRKLVAVEELKEIGDFPTSKYDLLLDAEELKEKILNQRRRPATEYGHGFWVARRWWKYRPKLPYLYFLEKVKRNEVKVAVYSPDMTKLYVIMKHGFPSEYVVNIPADPFLRDTLLAADVEIEVMPRSRFVYALRTYAIMLPCMYTIYVLHQAVFRGRQNAAEMLTDIMKMDTSRLVQPWEAAEAGFPTYNDVIIDPNVWAVVEEVSNYLSDPMKYYDKKLFLPRGILIHGPPGTGKTHLARAMAREMKLPFIYASGAEFGQSGIPGPQKIFDLFYTARANAPSVVFIDEIDALAGKHVDDDYLRDLTFKQLLKELDGGPIDTEVYRFSRRQSWILICATNRRNVLHEAFLQPGRIDRELFVDLPREKERIKIFNVHSAEYRLAEDVDFKKIVYRTKGFSGADIKNFVEEVAVAAKERGSKEICQQDLLDILDGQLFEGIGMTVAGDAQKQFEEKVDPEKKRLIAVHEAGHVLLAHIFPRFDWHAFTHLLPSGRESALTVFYPPEDVLDRGGTIGYVRAQMTVAHGGRCAERLIFGEDFTDGWQDDISRISALARELAVHPSNPRLGLLDLIRKPREPEAKKPPPPELYPKTWYHPEAQLMDIGPEISELLGREIQRYIDETERIAMDGLVKNRHILEKLADELQSRIKMTGDEARELVHSMNPVLLEDLVWVPPQKLNPLEGLKPGDQVLLDYEDLAVYQAPLHRC